MISSNSHLYSVSRQGYQRDVDYDMSTHIPAYIRDIDRLLQRVSLEHLRVPIINWCNEEGARFLYELVENQEWLIAAVQPTIVERSRLAFALEAASGDVSA